MGSPGSSPTPFNVIVAGAGVAGLEAALALRDFGDEHLAITMVAPDPEFVYRPMTVREPFAYAAAARYPLEEIARDIGVELIADRLNWLDTDSRVLHTDAGQQLSYDAALARPRGAHAAPLQARLTIDDRRLDELLHGLIQDVEGGYVHRLAFIVPPRMGWPLPIYELALMTAARAYDMNIELSSHDHHAGGRSPGDLRPRRQQRRLTAAGGERHRGHHLGALRDSRAGPRRSSPGFARAPRRPDRRAAGALRPVRPRPPRYGAHGFIPVDSRCRVRGVQRVYAAGDATDFAIKHGGIAAQQADVAAQAIAALAGIADAPKAVPPRHPRNAAHGRQAALPQRAHHWRARLDV